MTQRFNDDHAINNKNLLTKNVNCKIKNIVRPTAKRTF